MNSPAPFRPLELDLLEVGILASLLQPLAEAKVSIFALSTCDTDYLLVAGDRIRQAVRALTEAGHIVHTCELF